MLCKDANGEVKQNYFTVQLKTSGGHLVEVDKLHMVLEAFKCSAVNSRLWKVVLEVNTIFLIVLLLYVPNLQLWSWWDGQFI